MLPNQLPGIICSLEFSSQFFKLGWKIISWDQQLVKLKDIQNLIHPCHIFKKLSFKKSFRLEDLDLALHLRTNNPIQNLYLHVDPHFVPMTLY